MSLFKRCVYGLLIYFLIAFLSTSGIAAGKVVADHNSADEFSNIPPEIFSTVRSNWNIYYGHTSHGSQIVTGMEILERENPHQFELPPLIEDDPDLGYPEEWESKTRAHLADNAETNLVIWSWCGQLSWYGESEVDQYLNTMTQLENDYPGVRFVYMTGHLDGGGISGTLYSNNNRIRTFCNENNKILFDFADIESYDPNGNYYPDESDWCDWCTTWCESHTCSFCDDCAHSQCFNCYRKGKAFWWMLATLSGWTGTPWEEVLQLSSDVDGVRLSLSWNSVSCPSGYVLYYAFPDTHGHVDMNTLGFLNMGAKTALSADLWHGASLFVAISSAVSSEKTLFSNLVFVEIE